MSPRRHWFAPVTRRRLLGAMFVFVCLVIAGESWRYHRQCVAFETLKRLGRVLVWPETFGERRYAIQQKSPRMFFNFVVEDFLRNFHIEEPEPEDTFFDDHLPRDRDMDVVYVGSSNSVEDVPGWREMRSVCAIEFPSPAGIDELQQYAKLWPNVRELSFCCDDQVSQCELTELVHRDLEGCRRFHFLRYLIFDSKIIGAEDVEWVATLPSLRRVILRGCQITPTALESFRKLKASSRLWSVSIDSHEIE